jgi:LacI family transcriptional regulator
VAATSVNQYTLAKKLNLSAATVSRSLRNHPDISPETRERVLQEATRAGYRIHSSQRLALKNSLLLGVFLAENASAHTTPVERMYMTGMSEVAQEQNALLFTHYLSGVGDERILDPQNQPPALRSGMIAGLALIHAYKPEVVARLSANLPCVTITHHAPSAPADHIDSNHGDGILALVEHLVSLGHRKIGFIRRQPSLVATGRLGSFIQAHYRLRMTWDPALDDILLVDGGVDEENSLADRLVSKIHEGVTAWACDSDGTAYTIYRQLIKRGIKVSEDVSLVGYDGLEPFENCPQVTTIRVPFVEMGRAAIRQLLARFEHPKMLSRQIILQGEFIEGKTTGPKRN